MSESLLSHIDTDLKGGSCETHICLLTARPSYLGVTYKIRNRGLDTFQRNLGGSDSACDVQRGSGGRWRISSLGACGGKGKPIATAGCHASAAAFGCMDDGIDPGPTGGFPCGVGMAIPIKPSGKSGLGGRNWEATIWPITLKACCHSNESERCERAADFARRRSRKRSGVISRFMLAPKSSPNDALRKNHAAVSTLRPFVLTAAKTSA